MKITNSTVIEKGEKGLIDAIIGDLAWGAMEEIFRREHGLPIGEDVEYKSGDLIVHDSQVAYKLEFDVKVSLSVLVDRDGNCLTLATSQDNDERREHNEKKDGPSPDDGAGPLPNGDAPIQSKEGMQERIFHAARTAGEISLEMGERF